MKRVYKGVFETEWKIRNRSSKTPILRDLFSVYPAPAGMILFHRFYGLLSLSIPRASGDDPKACPAQGKAQNVYPAPAGMIQGVELPF